MYVIVVYDVWDKKTNKIHKYLKKRLHWIQNSVFEGELSKSEFIRMKWELKKKINEFKKQTNQENNMIHVEYITQLKNSIASRFPKQDKNCCFLEAGIIKGAFIKYTGLLNTQVKETKCVSNNHDFCEFEVRILPL